MRFPMSVGYQKGRFANGGWGIKSRMELKKQTNGRLYRLATVSTIEETMIKSHTRISYPLPFEFLSKPIRKFLFSSQYI
jgi:hypothetical protein